MAFIALCYMYFDLFALQHIADRPGEYGYLKYMIIFSNACSKNQPVKWSCSLPKHPFRNKDTGKK